MERFDPRGEGIGKVGRIREELVKLWRNGFPIDACMDKSRLSVSMVRRRTVRPIGSLWCHRNRYLDCCPVYCQRENVSQTAVCILGTLLLWRLDLTCEKKRNHGRSWNVRTPSSIALLLGGSSIVSAMLIQVLEYGFEEGC